MALAAGAPGLPKTAEIAGLDTAAATGLMALLVLATTFMTPIISPLLLTGVSVTFWDIALGMILTILVPLGISLFGSGGLLASLILVMVYLVAGYLLGGSDASNK